MPDKLTDNEIVKAKELIKMLQEAYNAYYDTSKGMPYNIDETLRESAFCLENCLNEINRLQAEIERLKESASSKCEDCAGCTSWLCDCANIEAYAKAEAYKEFAERLKKRSYRIAIGSATTENRYVAENNIDNLLKELVGET